MKSGLCARCKSWPGLGVVCKEGLKANVRRSTSYDSIACVAFKPNKGNSCDRGCVHGKWTAVDDAEPKFSCKTNPEYEKEPRGVCDDYTLQKEVVQS